MICFEVIINGEKVCTAGTVEHGGMSAIFSYVNRGVEQKADEEAEEPRFSVGGLKDDVFSEWLSGILEIGDEVTIRIVEANEFDAPAREYRKDPEEEERHKREFYERCKREYEGT